MIQIVVESNFAVAQGPFPLSFIRLLGILNGKKVWRNGKVRFEANAVNLRKLQESDLAQELEFIDKTGDLEALKEFESLPPQQVAPQDPHIAYTPETVLRDYQNRCLFLSWDRVIYAIFIEMGLGKTAIEIANAGMLFVAGRVTGMVILAPKGVHRQWLLEQFPEHFDKKIPCLGYAWENDRMVPRYRSESYRQDKPFLEIISLNTDCIRGDKGYDLIVEFSNKHRGKFMFVIDESHDIANSSAARSMIAFKLGRFANYKRILTGTPMGKDVTGLFSQFKFLDTRIFGDYLSAFKAEFCIIEPNEHRVVGQKNTERLYSLMAPHTFRYTKKEAGLNLPDKVYANSVYEMSPTTKRHYDSMRKTWMTQFENGEIKDAKNGVSALLRLQQIIGGYLEREDGTFEEIGGGERIECSLGITRQTEGQTLIWCRFTEDILRLNKALCNEYGDREVCLYYGGMTDRDRNESKTAFKVQKRRFWIGNSAISKGLDGLQGAVNEIFYSNSFNAIHRWQSEDRAHRIGMGESLTIFDVLADKSIDFRIMKNLKNKKDAADLTLDEIRMMICEDTDFLNNDDAAEFA